MGKKYMVRFDRDSCIGAAACVGMDPKDWIIDMGDGKANLIDGKETSSGMWEKEIDESKLDVNLNAAKGCPVLVIHIFDKETGEQIF
jgi:ferredoxin